jgi:hypothetical protein
MNTPTPTRQGYAADGAEPLLVPVLVARKMLGGIGRNQFWELAKNGELELVGSEYKRWVTVASIKARVARMIAAAQAEKDQPPSARR